MYKCIKINDFRLLKNQSLMLGKFLTVLSGVNSTGKSTVLGMLANSAELKKSFGTTYTGKQFKAEFSELFKGSKKFDKIGTNKFLIEISDESGNIIDYRSFRTAWQRKTKKLAGEKDIEAERFRVIPFKKLDDGKKTEAKFEYPVLYLGLSRLYPIGEANDTGISSNDVIFSSEEHKKWFIETYSKILSIHSNIIDITDYSIGEINKKNGIGITTESYDYLTNSSGQDNLGQILLALLSFRKLQESSSRKWNGGILLIDEIDATLHPSAQNRLLDLLIKEARRMEIQVVVTTHSLSLLKEITKKIENNSFNNDKNNNIELYYFTNANRELQIKRNLPYSEIENYLTISSVVQNSNRIKVYSEDAEARWFIEKLIPKYLMYIDLLNVKIGCKQLMSLYVADLRYFGNVLIVFDGDVSEKEIKIIPEKIRNNLKNIINLPGNVRPEQVIYDYILSLPPEHPYWSAGEKIGLTWDYFNDNGPNSNLYGKEKEREKYKEWFNEHKSGFESTKLMDFWIEDNQQNVEKFTFDFLEAYNHIARRICTYKIN